MFPLENTVQVKHTEKVGIFVPLLYYHDRSIFFTAYDRQTFINPNQPGPF